jgi:hypothetical protein
MYYDDHLEDAYEEVSDVTSEETTSSVDTQIKEQRKLMERYKRSNPDYYRTNKLVDGEIKKIETYSTPHLCNAYIRHAVDGVKCPHRAGSKYEDLYFIVTDTTTCSQDPRRLYFFSPEEYERHFFTTVSQSIKEDWNIKNMRANMLYNT